MSMCMYGYHGDELTNGMLQLQILIFFFLFFYLSSLYA